MKVWQKVRLSGTRGPLFIKALLDTGASRTLVPLIITKRIGAEDLRRSIPLTDVHKHTERHPAYKMDIYFPNLDNRGNSFEVATHNLVKCIIGVDVMGPLGINVHPQTGSASVTNKLGETVVSILALIGLGYGISKLPDIKESIQNFLKRT